MNITQAKLLEMLEYRDGELYWKKPNSNRLKVGEVAGCIEAKGYRVIMVKGKKYKTHKLVWLMFHGTLPATLDHINGIKSDNRVENLRLSSISENNQNCTLRKDNRSGVKNVCLHKGTGKWGVSLSVRGQAKHFGLFEDLELAALVAYEAREKYHGKFANHGAIAA